ncbi:hypothetical protein Daesc_000848 [Daldinia eschscholtzii]|uniref:Cupin type-1 domain-containing protein n=1 Tax=Daldinia eschscholtzii TaxID=292717 RepID=A0AAX6MZL7_9PEZI
MFNFSTIAAILAFSSIASAAPANRREEWSTSYIAPSISGTTTGWVSHETSSASSYSTSLSYTQSTSSTEKAEASATGNAPAPTGAGSPATPTGLSKVQQILLSDTRVDAINNVLKDDADFVFDFNKARKFGPGEGGEVVTANRKAFPALTGTGIGMAVGFLGPCGFNTPHVHNRATELLIVTKGKVVSEMVVENGVENADKKPRDIMNTIEELQATPYFMGALHTQFNPTCDDVVFIAPLSSEDFGANTIAQAYFSLEDDTIRAAAGNHIDGADVDKFRGIISTNVALGVEQCLKTCGIAKR